MVEDESDADCLMSFVLARSMSSFEKRYASSRRSYSVNLQIRCSGWCACDVVRSDGMHEGEGVGETVSRYFPRLALPTVADSIRLRHEFAHHEPIEEPLRQSDPSILFEDDLEGAPIVLSLVILAVARR